MEAKTDRELLAAFAGAGDETAFAELVARHGTLVFRVCFRMLGNTADAEDAAQAVFAVFAVKWKSIRRTEDLSSWFYSVARRTSLMAIRTREKQKTLERETSEMQQAEVNTHESVDDSNAVMAQLDDALNSLSFVQRQAVILRYLEGQSLKTAAALAGCPEGTLGRRASDGIANLRARLSRRGIAVSIPLLLSLLANESQAAIPETLLQTITSATQIGAAGAVPVVAGSKAMFLAKGVMKIMFWNKVWIAAATVALISLAGVGVSASVQTKASGDGQQEITTPSASQPLDETNALVVSGLKLPLAHFPDGTQKTVLTAEKASMTVNGNVAAKGATLETRRMSAGSVTNSFISITATTCSFDKKRSRADFEGAAVMHDLRITIKADRMQAILERTNEGMAATANGVKSLTATGHVSVDTQDATATCDNAVFTPKTGELILSGNTRLKKDADVISGDRIVLSLDNGTVKTETSGRAVIAPPAAPAEQSRNQVSPPGPGPGEALE